ncbi:ATP-dependent helicase [Patescibacteria group bacterium]|nr:ATP-dependent helicase [Patescibacteria group bacterium]
MSQLDFKNELNKEQYEVVTSGKGPHLVLAGAGSGKTRTLTYRAAWLVDSGVDPARILLLTFTNKAASEMIARVRHLLGIRKDAKFPLWGGTFHSVANRLLRIYGKAIGVEPNFTIMDSDDSESLIKMISKEMLVNMSEKNKPSASLFKETISFATNSKLSIEEALETKFPEWMPLLEIFEKIAGEYQRRKKESNVLDFDDLLIFWKAMTEHPEVSKKLQDKWDYILVDEYQDTNTIQAEIIFNLAQTHKNILAVGDDAQSIYSFRAADIRNILEFPDRFSNTKIYKLETNYRSTPEILDLANDIIKANNYQFAKNLKAVKEAHVRPELVALMSHNQEASYIADKIEELIERGMRESDIAVLFRASSHSRALEMELNRRGINYEMRGGLRFFERAHVKDVLAYLKVLGNFRDEVSWMRVLHMYEGIGAVTAQLIYQKISALDKLEDILDFKIEIASKAAKSWSELIVTLEALLQHKDENLSKLLAIIINQYSFYLMSKYTDYKYRQDDLEQLALFATEYDSLELFLNEISLQESYSAKQNREQNQNAVVLSTVHQAKGLEWPAVFVMSMTDQSFPHPLSVSEEEREEERRLFYVAVTRAEKYLFLTYPLAMIRYDGLKQMKPSPFVVDIDSRLLQYNDLARSVTFAAEDGVEYTPEEGSFLPSVDDW